MHLVGREQETNQINSLLDNFKKGESFFLLVNAEEGVGKTSLVNSVLQESNIKYFVVRASQNISSPFSLFSSVIRKYLRENSLTEVNFGPLTKYLGVFLPEVELQEKNVEKETTIEALCNALTIISSGEPLILFFDDLQWADNTSLETIPLFFDKITDSGISIIGTYRKSDIKKKQRLRWLRNEVKRRRKLYEINLSPFNIADTEVLLKILLNAKPSYSLVQLFFQKSKGVPLFIEEIAQTVLDKNLLNEFNGEVVLKDSAVPVPESITDIVSLKMISFSDNARQIIEIAAVAGDECDLKFLSGVNDYEKSLQELTTDNFLSISDQGSISFKHPLFRDAVISEMNWKRKKEINKFLAELMSTQSYPVEVIANYWLNADESEKAKQCFLKAAENFCEAQAYGDAASIIDKALEIWSPAGEERRRREVQLQLANCLYLSGELKRSIIILKEIIEASLKVNDKKLLGSSYRLLATIYGFQDKWDLVAQLRKNSANSFLEADFFEEAAGEFLAAAARFTALVDLNEALNCVKKAAELAERVNNISIRSKALGLKGNILAMQGNPVEGKNSVQKGLDLALENNLTEAASELYRRLASTMEYQSDYISAKSAYNNAYNFCVASGSEFYAQICLGCMSYIFFQTGEWKKALEVCNDVLRNKKSPDGSRAAALCITGLIYAFRGQVKSSEKYLNQSYRLSKKVSNNIVFFAISWGKGVLAENKDDFDEVTEHLNDVLELWKITQDKHDSIPVLMWGARQFSKLNSEKDLITCIENLSQISNDTSNPEALSALAFALAEFSAFQNKFEGAVEKFENSLLHQQKIFVPLEKMIIEHRLGEVLLLLNDEEKAAEHLNSAFGIAKNLGIRPYASQITFLLSKLGQQTDERSKRDQYDPSKSAHLTKRQNEILKLLLKGLTNKEIAERVFLSTRTIDMHVSHILERLNCRTRTEAITKAKELDII